MSKEMLFVDLFFLFFMLLKMIEYQFQILNKWLRIESLKTVSYFLFHKSKNVFLITRYHLLFRKLNLINLLYEKEIFICFKLKYSRLFFFQK